MNYDDTLKAALALSYRERLMLVEAIDETLHPPPKYTPEELAELIHRRVADYESGRAKVVSAEDAIRELRALVKHSDPDSGTKD